ncbi:MAG TPA: DUF4268 domain-containing protein [Stenomitos sp.]
MTSEQPAKPNLGRLEKVDLAAYWASDASDFLPWLAQPDNIKLLGEAIGLGLEVVLDTAHTDADGSALLCRDVATGRWVLVGSQLYPADEKYLGQFIMDAADIDATVVVWIASCFTPEHRASVAWLNRIANARVLFYALEIELWRIGTVAMAARFNPAVLPQGVAWASDGETEIPLTTPLLDTPPEPSIPEPIEPVLSPTQQQNLALWTEVCDQLAQHGSIVKPVAPVSEDRIGFAIGRAGFRLYALVDRSLNANEPHPVDLYTGLSFANEDGRAYFNLLAAQQEAIAAEVGIPLTWNHEDDSSHGSIYCSLLDANLEDEETWPSYVRWICNSLEQLHEAFADRIQLLDANDFSPDHPANGTPLDLIALQDTLILPSEIA